MPLDNGLTNWVKRDRDVWSSGVRRIDAGGLGGPGGNNPFGADGTRGGDGAGDGNPVLLDKASAMAEARGEAQQNIDNANTGAANRAAEMGLDFEVDQANLIAGASGMALSANRAGMMVDQQNVGAQNQFGMAKMQNGMQNERFYASLSNNQSQFQQQNQMQMMKFNENNRRERRREGIEDSSARESARLAQRSLREQRARQRRANAGPSNYERRVAEAQRTDRIATYQENRGARNRAARARARTNRRADSSLNDYFGNLDRQNSSMR